MSTVERKLKTIRFLFTLLLIFTFQILSANSVYLKPRVILEKSTVKLSDIARLHKDVKDRVVFG